MGTHRKTPAAPPAAVRRRRSAGRRGAAAAGPRGRRPWRRWTTDALRVGSTGPIPAGIDGEAALLEPPAEFRVRPGVLRVRVAVGHPGASPSSVEPVGALAALRALARIAAGRPAARALRSGVPDA